MKLPKLVLAACAATLFATQSAVAALTLQLNTFTKEFTLLGSDTGTLLSGSGESVVNWSLDGVGGSGSGDLSFTEANVLSWFSPAGAPLATEISSIADDGGVVSITLRLQGNITDPATINGSGIFQSYAGFAPDAMARFESTIGSQLPLNAGTGFSSISVTAVPEPMTYAAIVGFATLGIAFISRRRRVAIG